MSPPLRPLVAALLLGLALLAASPGCLGLPPLAGTAPPVDEPASFELRPEPAAELLDLPPVVRLHLTAREGEGLPSRVVLLRGLAGLAEAREVSRGTLSDAVAARVVPLRVAPPAAASLSLVGGEGGADGAEAAPAPSLLLTPEAVLSAGQAYSLVTAEPPQVVRLRVREVDDTPLARRLWPPPDDCASPAASVWCADEPLPELDEAVLLEPSGLEARVRAGAQAGDGLARCVHLELPAEVAVDGELAPPIVGVPPAAVRLEPVALRATAPSRAAEARVCAAGELAFGPGCATLRDDRAVVAAPAAALLWTVTGAGLALTEIVPAGGTLTVAGLAPSSAFELLVGVVDNRGVGALAAFAATTPAPMPHVVLSEVLADPLGKEPEQEWVELVNVGSVAAELGGYVLSDAGGPTALPPATLPAGGYALLVNEGYAADDPLDPSPPPSALLLRVPKLGRNGLSNSGEALSLRDAAGALLSELPATPKPRAGKSLARRSPEARDEPSAFMLATPTPGRANEVLGVAGP